MSPGMEEGKKRLTEFVEWGKEQAEKGKEEATRQVEQIWQGETAPQQKIIWQGEIALQQIWQGETALQQKMKESAQTNSLEVMPEEVKVLYARVLVAQSLVDGVSDPKEIEYLYKFMSRVGLSQESRAEVRQSLTARETRPSDIVDMVGDLLSRAQENESIVSVSVIKDMTRISRSDGEVSPSEQQSIRAVAETRFGEEAGQVMELADEAIDYDEALLRGASIGELENRGKQLASLASGIGVPIAAIYFSGSVVGLSAAGITSGLAALGLGGILGLSAMVTGIGLVVVAGVALYGGVRWALGYRERELENQREHMLQEIIKDNQQAIVDLGEDRNDLASRMEEYTSRSEQNEADLAFLREELQAFRYALAGLEREKKNLEDRREQYAT